MDLAFSFANGLGHFAVQKAPWHDKVSFLCIQNEKVFCRIAMLCHAAFFWFECALASGWGKFGQCNNMQLAKLPILQKYL